MHQTQAFREHPMASKKILIVDDSKVTRSMVVYALGSQGFEVLEAEDARTALGIVARSPVDMVITDMRMPEVDGVSLTRQLRQRHSAAELPILMVTGFEDAGCRELALEAGVSSFLTKPFKPQQLLTFVRSVLC